MRFRLNKSIFYYLIILGVPGICLSGPLYPAKKAYQKATENKCKDSESDPKPDPKPGTIEWAKEQDEIKRSTLEMCNRKDALTLRPVSPNEAHWIVSVEHCSGKKQEVDCTSLLGMNPVKLPETVVDDYAQTPFECLGQGALRNPSLSYAGELSTRLAGLTADTRKKCEEIKKKESCDSSVSNCTLKAIDKIWLALKENVTDGLIAMTYRGASYVKDKTVNYVKNTSATQMARDAVNAGKATVDAVGDAVSWTGEKVADLWDWANDPATKKAIKSAGSKMYQAAKQGSADVALLTTNPGAFAEKYKKNIQAGLNSMMSEILRSQLGSQAAIALSCMGCQKWNELMCESIPYIVAMIVGDVETWGAAFIAGATFGAGSGVLAAKLAKLAPKVVKVVRKFVAPAMRGAEKFAKLFFDPKYSWVGKRALRLGDGLNSAAAKKIFNLTESEIRAQRQLKAAQEIVIASKESAKAAAKKLGRELTEAEKDALARSPHLQIKTLKDKTTAESALKSAVEKIERQKQIADDIANLANNPSPLARKEAKELAEKEVEALTRERDAILAAHKLEGSAKQALTNHYDEAIESIREAGNVHFLEKTSDDLADVYADVERTGAPSSGSKEKFWRYKPNEKNGFLGKLWTSMKSIGERKPSSGSRILDLDKRFKGVISDKSENIITRLKTVDSKIQWKQFRTAKDLDATLDIPLDLSKRLGRDPNKFPVDEFEESLRRWTQFQSKGTKSMGIDSKDVERFKSYWENKLLGVDRLPEPSRYLSKKQMDQIVDAYGRAPRASGVTIREGIDASKKTWRDDFIRQGLHDHLEKTGAFAGRPGGIRFSEDDLKMIGEELAKKADQEALERASKSAVKKAEGPAEAVLGEVRLGEATLADTKAISVSPISRATLDGEASLKLQKIEKELADLRVGKEWTKDVNKIRNHLMREDALMKQAAQIRGKLNPRVDEISKHVRAIEAKTGPLSDAEKLVYAHHPGLQKYVEQGLKNPDEFKSVLRELVETENKKTIDAAVKALGDLTEKQKENILRAHYHDPLGAGKIKELIGGSGNLSRKQTLGRVRILSEGEGALTPEQYQRLMDRSIVGGGASHGAKSLDTPSSGFFQYSIGPAPKPSSLASEAEIARELQNAIKRYDGYTKHGVSPTIDNFVEKVRIGRRNGAKEIDAAVALEREFESFESYLRKQLNSSSHPLRDKEHAKELIEKMDNIIEEVLSKTSDPMSIPLSFRKQLADKIQKYAVEFAPSGARDWKKGDLLRKWMPEKKYFNDLTEVKATAWKDAKRAIHWESLSPETQLKIENALYRSHLSGNRTAQQIEDLKQPWIREFQKKNARSPTPAELDAFTPPATKDKIRALVDASKKVEETLLKELGEGPLKHLTKGNPRYIKDRVIKPLADAKVLGVEEASDFVKNLPTNTDEIFEAAKQVKKNYSIPANKNVLIKGAIEDKSKLLEMQQEYFKLSAIKTGMIKHPPKDSGVINTVNSELKELSQILALAMPKHGSRFADFEKEVASQVAKYTDELNGPGTRAIDNAASTIASASSGAVARLPVDDVFKATTKDAQAVIGDDELVKKITGFAPMSNVSRRAKLEDLKRLAQKLEDELKATQLTSRSSDLPPGADFVLRARENAVDDIKKLIAKGESEFTDQMQRTQYVIREISTKYYPDFRQQQLINSQLTTSSGLARSIREAEEDAQRLKNIMRQRAEKGFDDLYHSTKTQMGDPPPKLDAIDDKLKEIEGHLDLLYKKKFQLEASNLPKTSSTKEMIEAGEKKLAVKLSDPEKLILAHNPALQRELLGELPNPKDFVAKLKSLAKEDEAHTLSKAAKELGVDVEDLSKPKRDAILAAHYVDPLGPGKTKALIGGAGNLSDAQIKKRIEILQPHFTKEEYKRLMDRGVVGGSPKNTEELLEEIKTVKDFRLSALRQQRKKLEEASGKLKAASNEAEKKIAQQLYDQAKRMVDQTESHIKKLDEEIKQISSGRANLSAKVTKKPEISFSLVSMESVPPIKIDETLSEAMKRDISAKGYLSGLANRPGEPKTWEDLKAQLQSHPEGVTNFQQVYGNMVSPITMVRLKGAHFAKLPPDDLWRLQAEASLAMHEWLRRNLNSIKTVEPKEHLEESFNKFDAGLKELFSDQNL